MNLDVVQVKVLRPLVGAALVEENELRRQRARLRRQTAELADAAGAEGQAAGAGESGEGRESGEGQPLASDVQAELEAAQAELKAVQKALDKKIKARTISIDVQTAPFGGRLRQMNAVADVEAWRRQQKLANLDRDVDDAEAGKGQNGEAGEPPDEEALAGVALTARQQEDYMVMSTCTAIEGAVCRDEQGRPVCSNFDWPETLHGWTGVPGYVVEALLPQIYALNPTWAPAWYGSPDEEPAKN